MADNERQPSNVETFVDKLASGDYEVKFMEWENEFCLEIQTHLDEDDDKCGITIYLRYDDEFNINKYKIK